MMGVWQAFVAILALGGVSPSLARTNYANAVLPADPANKAYKLTSYGAPLRTGKAKLNLAFAKCNATQPQRYLFTAMGMLETNTLSTASRDASKDNTTDGSANVSLFNLSVDMVQRLNYTKNPRLLNDPKNLPDAVCLLQRGALKWGVPRMLNFVRGGYTAFVDGRSYGAQEYRSTIKTIVSVFDKDARLMYDDRRVEVFLNHV
jgi:hypothetical protein